MKKTALLLTLLCLTLGSLAQRVDFNVVPLPRCIEIKDTVNCFMLKDGDIVSYPAGDVEMARNADFLKEYVEQTSGLKLQTLPNEKKAAITLTLSNNAKKKAAAILPEGHAAYAIQINPKGITVSATSGEGIFRAVQTLRKAMTLGNTTAVQFPLGTVSDAARFSYRGQMLDCARHFFPVDYIKRHIDILALHGVNQFHWHITDDQGWRFEVKSMPEMAKEACQRKKTVIGHNCYSQDAYLFDNTPYGLLCYYTQAEIRDIIRYAADRYINIIPEIDLPGHMVAALHVHPELGCTGGPYDVLPIWGVADDVLCAGNPQTLEFLKTVLGELCDVFPSQYIHIGGDESPRVRWKNCPKCQAKMKELGLKKEAELQTYINKELDKFLTQRGRTLIGWDETLEGGLSENAVVMSWRGYEGGIEAARQHHPVIMTPTSHCYIDYYQLKGETQTQPLAIGGYLPLSKVYSMEPMPDGLTPEEQKYIWGPQCNLWTEYVLSPDHVEYMLLPRLAAMSEVQWLLPDAKDYTAFKARLTRLQQLYRKLGYRYCSKNE